MTEQIFEEWDELTADFKLLEVDNRAYLQQLDELNTIQKKMFKSCSPSKIQNWYYFQIYKRFKSERVTLVASSKQNVDQEKLTDLKNNIMKRKAQLYEIEQTLPKSNGIYLKIILGNVNVSILNKEEKTVPPDRRIKVWTRGSSVGRALAQKAKGPGFKYKDEYEKFKLILSMIAIVMAVLNFCVRFRPLELIYIFLLVWYYCTLTIRESILKVNGSRIKGWWRLHHFLSTVAAGILLIWPDNAQWSHFRNQFMAFNIYISLVQYLQFRYQRGALYRLKALGERHNMDITIEGFHSWMWRGLSFLLPFLFIGYLFQLYNAYSLYLLSYNLVTTWHVGNTKLANKKD
ncbi:hypothetical protein NQ317_011144 [Molorchus minor]|uniref:Transmembrane protein 120 homolog n=1 Tax=Molorchus minor TaxID=1323400 RepID=A0ABQ9JEJ2_9CUCU|nr:hypothetical protein NQ317_011144 [Molorchus minor]